MSVARSLAERFQSTMTLFGEDRYRTRSWRRERRVVFKAEVMHAAGKSPRDNARFVITNLRNRPERVWQIYCKRGDSENRIKELKNDLDIDRTSCTSFLANQARVLLTAMAYVLFQELRAALRDTQLERGMVGTLRLRLLKIGATVTESIRAYRRVDAIQPSLEGPVEAGCVTGRSPRLTPRLAGPEASPKSRVSGGTCASTPESHNNRPMLPPRRTVSQADKTQSPAPDPLRGSISGTRRYGRRARESARLGPFIESDVLQPQPPHLEMRASASRVKSPKPPTVAPSRRSSGSKVHSAGTSPFSRCLEAESRTRAVHPEPADGAREVELVGVAAPETRRRRAEDLGELDVAPLSGLLFELGENVAATLVELC